MARANEARFMREAIALSLRGFPAPNPRVGCLIVRDGEVVGRGWHDHAGGPHAEIVALAEAGDRAKGATAYSTLEPCNHQGRTGPCSEALIAAGVRRVVFAVGDPNPKACGGAERLRAAGIEVVSGLLESSARKAMRPFLFAHKQGRPWVVLKAAASLDGRIALPSGESQWLTGPLAREAGHRLRAEMGAVLVGRRTVELDDPQLTARIDGVVNQPLRVVLDPRGVLASRHRVFDGSAPTLHLTSSVLPLVEGAFPPAAVLAEVRRAGANGLLIEGGAKTSAAFLATGLVEQIELFLAPAILGAGPSFVEGLLADRLEAAPRFRVVRTRRLGEDIQVSLLRR